MFGTGYMRDTVFTEIEESGACERSMETLYHNECACCGRHLEDFSQTAVVAATVSTVLHRDSRVYFPFYHLVCGRCRSVIDEGNEDSLDRSLIPEWSYMNEYILYTYRPRGIALARDLEAVNVLVTEIGMRTISWEEFNGEEILELPEFDSTQEPYYPPKRENDGDSDSLSDVPVR